MANRQPCPKCDELVPAGARECPECGARLTGRARRDDDADRPPARDRRGSDRPRKKKRSKAKTPNRFLIPAIAGGAILLAGVTVAVIWAAGWFGGGRGTGGEPQPERSKTAVNQFEPVAWAVPDGAAPIQPWPAAITLPGVKMVAFPPGPRRTFLAVQVEVDKSDAFHAGRDALVAGELDPNTGQPMPAVRRLDPRLIVPAKSRMVPMALPPATVNGAGVLATRGLEPGSVEFHAADGSKRSARFGTAPIDWLGWVDDSTLLVLTGGKLIGWDVAAGRAGFTAGGEYQLPAVASPARNWFAVSVGGKYLDLVDAKTGTCKGRIGGEGNWQALAVSPDATRLAGARTDGPTGGGVRPAQVHAWDLKSGRRTGVVPATSVTDGPTMRWRDSNRLHLISAEAGLLDMEKNVLLARLTTDMQRFILADGPDGRAWARADLTLKGIAVVAPVEVSLPAGNPAFHPGVGVRVEVDCGDPKRTERASATLTDILKDAGYPAGGDWVLRLKAAEHDGKVLTYLGSEVKMPAAKGTFELVAPDGTVAGTAVYNVPFPERASRYFTKSEHNKFVPGGPGVGGGRTDLYNFGGRDPRKAMSEETWDVFIKGLESSPIPRGAWHSPTGYQALPLNNIAYTSALN